MPSILGILFPDCTMYFVLKEFPMFKSFLGKLSRQARIAQLEPHCVGFRPASTQSLTRTHTHTRNSPAELDLLSKQRSCSTFRFVSRVSGS